MAKSILITGGARSGKSALAERLTLEMGRPAIYIATAEIRDDEMADRVARHRARRGADWRTIAAPLRLSEALDTSDGDAPRLVDCLTLWLSNTMLAGEDAEAAMECLAESIARQRAPLTLVTNEVGAGIVPENALARRFRDCAGLLNQRIARICDEVFLCVAGYPLQVK